MTTPTPRPEPLGFGRCAKCPYLKTGTPEICFGCARKSFEALDADRCQVCDLPFKSRCKVCANPICNWDDRDFGWNYAAAMRSGILKSVLDAYKYQDKRGWALIFARVLVGFLNQEMGTFASFDLIVPSPTFVGEDGRAWDHTRAVILEASELDEDGVWPFDIEDPPAIIKTAATERMMGKKWKERDAIARGPLRDSLVVPRPDRIAGRDILVYDDIFTDGHTLNEVARALIRQGGAKSVCGVTLMRQPFGK